MSASPAAKVWPVDRRGALLLAVAAVVVWIILPTAPNYDTATHLMWAGELLGGRAPDVSADASPTLHPLWLVVAVPAAATGMGAAWLQLVALLSFAVVIACAYRLATDVAGWIAGAFAAVAVASSFALMLLAFKAYVDLPFLALVLTALVVEWSSDRAEGAVRADQADRGAAEGEPPVAASRSEAVAHPLVVPGLLFTAGLLRPEAWAFGVLFVALRVVRGSTVREQVVPAAVVLAAPVLWLLTDLLLTGEPLHSLTGTQALAEELGRKTGLAAAPRELAVLLSDLARPPVAAAGVLGVALAVRLRGWRALLLPLTVLAAAGAGFLLVGALGLPLLQRYLLVPAVLVCVFAGVAGGVVLAWARGRRDPGGAFEGDRSSEGIDASGESVETDSPAAVGRRDRPGSPVSADAGVPTALRLGATAALVVGLIGVGGYLVLKAESFKIVGQGVLREARWQREGAELLADPAVIAAARCGPITLPTYRFIPELTLRADLPEGAVVSRSTALGGAGPQENGVAIVIDGNRAAKVRLGWAAGVPRTTNQIPPGFGEIARRGPFVATARCA
ncbi:MAG: hypothetical protein JHD16_05530 [Solirubrobacteraceae bacterium]|nr:hypothetical protein [Solirubrobacteraceae bacterium]